MVGVLVKVSTIDIILSKLTKKKKKIRKSLKEEKTPNFYHFPLLKFLEFKYFFSSNDFFPFLKFKFTDKERLD